MAKLLTMRLRIGAVGTERGGKPMTAARAAMTDAARGLVRGAIKAALASIAASADGTPHAALVTVACDVDGAPLLLLSDLSAHTCNLHSDPRLALLYDGTGDRANPQEGPRVTVIGTAAPTAEPRCRARFLARHPGAARYADFGDFAFWRITVERLHFVGGFAQAGKLPGTALIRPESAVAALAAAEPSILDHMNADHGDALDLIAARLLRRRGAGWRMTGIDPDGCDMMRGNRRARLVFSTPIDGPDSARNALVALTQAARNTPPGQH
jgi:putative heme iron utilization protein